MATLSTIEEAANRLAQLNHAGVDSGTSTRADGPGQEAMAAKFHPRGETAPPPARDISDPTPPAVPRRPPSRGSPDARTASEHLAKTVQLDLRSLGASGFVTPDTQKSQLSHEFRLIKRPLLKNAKAGAHSSVSNSNVIMVTSALPGEGKTFVSVNLALSISMEMDHRVLLIDADAIAPSIPAVLGVSSSRGLLNLLSGSNTDFSDVLLKTNIERLSLILAGTPHKSAVELLASRAMGDLVNEPATRYADRIVIFDSPPLLPTAESRSLANHMGQVIVVVEANKTSQGSVDQALAALESCPIVMTMLNKASTASVGGYYNYGGYGQKD